MVKRKSQISVLARHCWQVANRFAFRSGTTVRKVTGDPLEADEMDLYTEGDRTVHRTC
jgi:hypothetical protein